MDDKKPAVTSSKAKSSTGLFDDDDDDDSAAATDNNRESLFGDADDDEMNKDSPGAVGIFGAFNEKARDRTSLFGSSDEEVDESDPLRSANTLSVTEKISRSTQPQNSKSLFGSDDEGDDDSAGIQKEVPSVEKPKEKEDTSLKFIR